MVRAGTDIEVLCRECGGDIDFSKPTPVASSELDVDAVHVCKACGRCHDDEGNPISQYERDLYLVGGSLVWRDAEGHETEAESR